ncbi:putative acyl-CoA reductase [Gordonia effusa NBRC 100432]|uniref:Putative acyl-CoA reductase n=1 Tax=Gordonia effusa NBRC 100432 TaxID=1077974 RepID=H0QUP2_9ACTN|nr:SDR family NAD(P)-dependent oxidoreductase [Gordonia effusa]GAB16543.1 putative acyl-CoA reductase [Gordonia effusa NBRC 100432]
MALFKEFVLTLKEVATGAVLWAVGPPMENDLERLRRSVEGRVVLITGASYGQGEATARLFAAAGARVILAARTKARLDEIAAEIAAAGGTAFSYSVDFSDLDAVDSFAARVLEEHSGVDVLVHNAGKSLRRSVYRSAERLRDMDAMVGVNFTGPMRLTLALLPSMKLSRGAHIINIATAGLWLTPVAPRWSFYIACKAGFDTWLRSIALEVRGDGIDVTTIYAGHIKSRMVATRWVSRMPGHTPDQAARILAYAASRRPRAMAPRSMFVVRVLGVIFEAPLAQVMSYVDSRSGETSASEAAYARAMAKELADAQPIGAGS